MRDYKETAVELGIDDSEAKLMCAAPDIIQHAEALADTLVDVLKWLSKDQEQHVLEVISAWESYKQKLQS